MTESFDRGERPGAYLEPILRLRSGVPIGGDIAIVGPGGCANLFGGVDRRLRRLGGARSGAVFTPPIYLGDAMASEDPAFAVAAMREFVMICLTQAPPIATR